MNKEGVKILAAVAVLAVALSCILVVSDDRDVDADLVPQYITGDQTGGDWTCDNDHYLVINSAVTIVSGTVNLLKALNIESTGSLTIAAGATLSISGVYLTVKGEVINNGTINSTNDGYISFQNGGELTNNGTLNNNCGCELFTGNNINTGTINSDAFLGIDADAMLINEGTIVNNYEYSNGKIYNVPGATITDNYEALVVQTIYTVSVAEVEHGTVSSDKRYLLTDQTATITATPDQGYELTAITASDGATIDGNTLTMGSANTTVTATFTKLATIFVSIPESAEGKFTTEPSGDHEVDKNSSYEFSVVPLEEHEVTVTATNCTITILPENHYQVSAFTGNVSVSVTATKPGDETREIETREIIENEDGTETRTSVDTTTDVETNESHIYESASTDGDVPIESTADVKKGGVTVMIGDSGRHATVTKTMSDAIKAAALVTGAADSSMTVTIVTTATSVDIPRNLLHDDRVKQIEVEMNGSKISMPKAAVAAGDLDDNFRLAVYDSDVPVPAGMEATDSFEIVILGSHAASFNAPVTVSVDRAVPFDATNVMFYCIENGDTVPATVAGDIVSADLLHFSHWAVIYDVPADVIVDDGGQLPPIWHYVPQQQASSSHTTTIMVAIAAAVAAIAVILVMLCVVRKN